jgi:predicted ATP-grasp superfamily ATP-dependent carboligase
MAVTKVMTIANLLDVPVSKCHLKKDNQNIVVVNETMEYLVFSEKRYGHGLHLNVASRQWYKDNAWRFPIEFILKYSSDEHHGFKGIFNEKLIDKLKEMQEELKKDFNELAWTIIQNKTKFLKDVVLEYGYKFMFQPVDDKEIVANGFRIYRIK